MFPNDYKKDAKHPDFKGSIKMTRPTLKELMMQHTEDDIEIKIAAWNMQGQRGPWIRLSWDNFKPSGNFSKPAPKQTPIEDDDSVPF